MASVGEHQGVTVGDAADAGLCRVGGNGACGVGERYREREEPAQKKTPQLAAAASGADHAGRYQAGVASALAPRAYFLRNLSTRPAVSRIFCLPVKNGWQAEHTSTARSWPRVERVTKA